MKRSYVILRGLWVLAAVVLVGLTGCKKDPEQPTQPYLNILYNGVIDNSLTLTPPVGGGDYAIGVEASRDWKMQTLTAGWLTVTPQNGKANATTTVNIHVNPNDGPAQSVTLTFAATDGSCSQKVIINQDGQGGPIGEDLYFEDLGAFKTGAQIRTASGIATGWPTIAQYGSVVPADGWKKGGSLDQSAVTYTGTGEVRNSGEAYDPVGGSTNSKAPYVYLGPASNFVINGVNTGGKTNFTFKFAAQNTASVTDYVPTFGEITPTTFKLEAGFDGTAWADLTFTPVLDGNGWYWTTSEFKVPAGTAKLYFKFTYGGASGSLRLDDFSLAEGGNGSLITPGGGDITETTIAALNARITADPVAAGDYFINAVVTTDMANGNFTKGSLSIMTEGATEAGNGILLYGAYGSNIEFVDGSGNPLYAAGDKIKVDISTMSIQAFRGKGASGDDPYCNEIIIPAGTTLTDVITKTGSITPAPVTITYDKIADFQGMLVKIEEVQSKADNVATWAAGGTPFTYRNDLTKEFPLYLAAGSNIVGKPFSTGNGTVTGVAYVYGGSASARSSAQIVPRSTADLVLTNPRVSGSSVFNVTTATPVTVPAAGGTFTVNVTANVAWTAEVVAGNTATLTAGPTPASGNANQAISLTFAANTVAEAKALTLRVSTTADVTPKTYDIVYNQAAAGASVFNVATETPVSVAAAGGAFTVNVSANVAWTAEVVAGSTATLTAGPTPASGNADQAIALTFAENADAAAKTLTLRVSTTADVTPKTYDIVYNQAAAGGAGGGTYTLDNATIIGLPSWAYGDPAYTATAVDNSQWICNGPYHATNKKWLQIKSAAPGGEVTSPTATGRISKVIITACASGTDNDTILNVKDASGTVITTATKVILSASGTTDAAIEGSMKSYTIDLPAASTAKQIKVDAAGSKRTVYFSDIAVVYE